MVKRFDDEIKDYTTKKESLNKKKSQLEEEIKANKKRKEELTSESEKLDKEIESSKTMSKEKKSNENFLNNFDFEHKELENSVNKFEKNKTFRNTV